MKRNLQSVAQFSERTPFSQDQLRWMIFNAAQNGLEKHDAVVRVGRRVYIDTEAFDRWIDSQQAKSGAQ